MNTLTDIWKFFSTEDRPVSTGEMIEFWQSLSKSEKFYYTMTPLRW